MMFKGRQFLKDRNGDPGSAYALLVARRMRLQRSYRPELEDQAFHVLLPMSAYAMLAVAAAILPAHFLEGLFIIAAAVLINLFTGIHNAWDAAAYHVLVN